MQQFAQKGQDARRAQVTTEAYVMYTPHKGTQCATQQIGLFQQFAQKGQDARRAQVTAEAYVMYTPHKGTQCATQQIGLFQQTNR